MADVGAEGEVANYINIPVYCIWKGKTKANWVMPTIPVIKDECATYVTGGEVKEIILTGKPEIPELRQMKSSACCLVLRNKDEIIVVPDDEHIKKYNIELCGIGCLAVVETKSSIEEILKLVKRRTK